MINQFWTIKVISMSRIISKRIKIAAFLLPSVIILSVFQIYPIFKSFLMAFYTKFDYLSGEVEEMGLSNFSNVLNDPDFILAVKNTFVFVLLAVPIGITVALIFALILDSNIRFKKFFQSVYFIPFITSTTAVSIMWKWMLNSDYGVVNAFLLLFGIPKVSWLTNPNTTIPILVAMSVWKGLGYKILIILAALQGIDKRYIDAGKIDGAGSLRRVVHIKIPLLKPVILFLLTTSVIGSFKLFDEIFIMYHQKPGPIQSGLTMVYYIIDKFYRHWEFAAASAAAFILFVIILVFTLLGYLIVKKMDRDS